MTGGALCKTLGIIKNVLRSVARRRAYAPIFKNSFYSFSVKSAFPMCAFTGFFTTTWRFTASVNAAGEQSTGVSAAESANPAGSGVAARLIRSPGRCAAR